jgi:hypothetical protein
MSDTRLPLILQHAVLLRHHSVSFWQQLAPVVVELLPEPTTHVSLPIKLVQFPNLQAAPS